MIVLFPDIGLVRVVGVTNQRAETVDGGDVKERGQGRRLGRFHPGTVVFGRLEESWERGRSAFTVLPCRMRKRSSGSFRR